MPEWVKELLISVGGGATATVAIIALLKSLVIKIVDKSIDTSFEKSTIKLSNKLDRSTRAYEYLIKKEFDYYEKTDPYMATLVPLVQDFKYWAEKYIDNASEEGKKEARENYRDNLLTYLKMIPEIKNDSVMFQPYTPVSVFDAMSTLLQIMQSDMHYLCFVEEILYEEADGTIDTAKLQEIMNRVLVAVAMFETRVKDRLTELSSN